LDGRPSLADPPVQVPLTDTPNWLMSVSPTTFGVSTSDVAFALSHFQDVYGTTRIVGGAVFEFDFDPSINLLTSADFSSMTAEATHGLDRYVAPGEVTFAKAVVPEPPTMLMIAPPAVFAPLRWRLRRLRLLRLVHF
jgi:hypothetical protein